jgi:phage anti-repressor protein
MNASGAAVGTSVRDFLKRYTTVPAAFVDELFDIVDENTPDTSMVIDIDKIAKWLGVRRENLIDTLRRTYVEDTDFTVKGSSHPSHKKHANNYKEFLVNSRTFKELAMSSKGENAGKIRNYLLQVEKSFIRFREQLIQGMQSTIATLLKNQAPRVKPGRKGNVYFLRVEHGMSLYGLDMSGVVGKLGKAAQMQPRLDTYNTGRGEVVGKLGKAGQMQRRLDTYNTGRANNIEVLYQIQTDDMDTVEKCVKLLMKPKQYRKRKEIYQVDLDVMKSVMKHCAAASADVRRVLGPATQLGGYYAVLSRSKA